MGVRACVRVCECVCVCVREREREKTFFDLSFFLSFGHFCRSLLLFSSFSDHFFKLAKKLKNEPTKSHFCPKKVPFSLDKKSALCTHLEKERRPTERSSPASPTFETGGRCIFFTRFIDDRERSSIA